jgi:tRNA(Ile)-lysidine synthase
MADLLTKIGRACARFGLIPPGARVLVAVSGGADSTALLQALVRLSEGGRAFSLEVAHLDHGLRGEESAEDARFVAEMAATLGLPCHLERLAPGSLERQGVSRQEAAREARLAWLERLAGEIGVQRIALGHSADDLAEEVLMRLLSGAGPRGLAGMRARRGPFIRPLIECRRSEIEAWLETCGIPWREDGTNYLDAYLRNRVRHRLLPTLEADYNPNLRESLVRQAAILGEEDDLLERLATEIFETLARVEAGSVAFPVVALAAEHPALQRRLLRLACERLAGSLRGIGFRHVELVRSLMNSPSPSAGPLRLPGNLTAERRYEYLVINLGQVGLAHDWDLALPGPGRYELAGTGLCLTLRLSEGPGGAGEALFDAASLSWPLLVRSPRRGDRFRPRGMAGTKLVFRLLSDAKVPRSARWRVPILLSAENIIWVGGLRMAEFASPTGRRPQLSARLEPA